MAAQAAFERSRLLRRRAAAALLRLRTCCGLFPFLAREKEVCGTMCRQIRSSVPVRAKDCRIGRDKVQDESILVFVCVILIDSEKYDIDSTKYVKLMDSLQKTEIFSFNPASCIVVEAGHIDTLPAHALLLQGSRSLISLSSSVCACAWVHRRCVHSLCKSSDESSNPKHAQRSKRRAV